MNVSRGSDSQEAIYEHFRRLVAQKESLGEARKHGETPVGKLQSRLRACGIRAVDVLESRATLSLVVSLSIIFAGLSAFFFSSPEWRGSPLIDLTVSSGEASASLASTSLSPQVAEAAHSIPDLIAEKEASQTPSVPTRDTFREAETGFDDGQAALTSDEVSRTRADEAFVATAIPATANQVVEEVSETFMVRVGSFRNPSNASRLEASLREQTSGVRVDVLANGLHAVMLGPFDQRTAAEDAAQSVQEAMNLVPQVLRVDR